MLELRTRLHWLLGLRVLVVTLLLGLSLVFQATRGELVPTFSALIVVTYALTIVSALLLRYLTAPRALTVFTWAQVAMDFLLETILVARTGGIESPFAVLYVVTVTVASLVPQRRVGLVTGAGCALLFGAMAGIQCFGVLNSDGWLPPGKLSGPEALQSIGTYGLAFLMVGFLSGILADQLRLADQSLREKEQGLTRLQLFHENIVRSISSGVFATDEVGRITSFNPAAHEVTGYTFPEVQGRSWREVFHCRPGEAGAEEVVTAPARFEVECRRADGSRLVLGMTVSPLQEQGMQRGLVGVFKDLTQIRYLEEEMRRKEWLANLGEMSAGMAHEIRNPLGALVGAMQMLRHDVGSDETSQRLMDIAIREGKRLDNIITEFLQYARPPALHLTEQDLNKVLAETLDLIQHEARSRRNMTIAFTAALGTLTAPVDQNQLKQVFWNLAVNAFDAMPAGGVLTISTGVRRVELGECRTNVIEIAFQDEGEGIPKQNFDKIFLPFFTTKKEGSGLGLAQVHRIVDLHGGWTKVESEVGKGTRFVVCLPQSPETGARLWHEGREVWKRF
ncbi:MAG: Adaptive-response sensory-kinase SasA [Nitrospirae bacterium]|nr:Adaptive-response sensory-kinase SasA [Nitrospirota bacterium]MCE7966029.1 PAS domain S-box protein [Nitrospira sp. NTP2]MCK6493577.1 ATP-binding protein [Nitrospira sp.]MEB2339017.1 ATP-binding protein [Nitrospirales bacterium]QOJ34848.1 MAG: PAS domain S-box protein [Nitrospira sp.]